MATPPIKKPATTAVNKPVANKAAASRSTSDISLQLKRDIAVAVIGQCSEQQLMTAPGKVISIIKRITDEVLG